MRDLYIFGAGGLGREVEALVSAVNDSGLTWRLAGFLDDAPSPVNRQRVEDLGHQVIGGIDHALGRSPQAVVVALADARTRQSVTGRLATAGWQLPALVHPDTTLGRRVDLSQGALVCAGVRTSTNIRLGKSVVLCANATIGHDVVLGDYSTVLPGAVVSGEVTLGDASLVGASATILQGLAVGVRATVGAGAVVVRDVPDEVIVRGVPAR
ncbi:NeuD/PglB/VioB family sugar acetyltransferase [Nostocoides vanveenii]|uniref:Acetyltransferase n=1 Tax=Nostocoides vanveenii TaxID=330835 RepID=A0ABN2L8Z9_9MICO